LDSKIDGVEKEGLPFEVIAQRRAWSTSVEAARLIDRRSPPEAARTATQIGEQPPVDFIAMAEGRTYGATFSLKF
jgi:hypothetical protein